MENLDLSLYNLIPIPFLNKTLIPRAPYLLVDYSDAFQWLSTLPTLIEDKFFLIPELISTEECFIELLRRRSPQGCSLTMIAGEGTPHHIEQISSTDYVIIPFSPVTVEYNCTPHAKKYKFITQTTRLSLTERCQFTVSNQTYFYEKPFVTYSTYIFPNISFDNIPLALHPKLSISELYHIQTKLSHLHSLKPIFFQEVPSSFNYMWLLLLLIPITLLGCYLWNHKTSLGTHLAVHFNKATEKATIVAADPAVEALPRTNVGSNPTPAPAADVLRTPQLPF